MIYIKKNNQGIVNGIEDIIAGTNTSIDKTDPKKPIINFTGEGTGLTPEQEAKLENTPDNTIEELGGKVDKEDGKGLIDTTKEANIPANTNQEFTNLKGGVPEAGNTLKKLHDLIIANEGNITNILTLLESDDELLDELQEVVDFIKNNRADLDNYVLELQNKVDKETGKGLISTTKEANIPEDTISELAGKVDKQTNHSLISNDDLLKVESIETTGDGTKYKSDDGTYKAVLPVNFTKNVEVQLNEYNLVFTNGRALMLLHHENAVGLSVQSPDGTYPLAGITIDENEINITGTAPLLYSDPRTLVDPLELVHKAYVDALRSEFETYKKGYIINFVFKDVLEVTHTIVHDVKFLTIDAPPGVTITGLTLNELLTKGTEITITSSGSGLVIIKGEKQ